MKTISIYDSTGQILRTVNCPESQVDVQIRTGESYLEGEFSGSEFQVKDGKPEKLPPQPTEFHVFNYISNRWDDPRTATTEWPLVRTKRDTLLSDTDWIVTKATEKGTTVPALWKTYRQALRDIPLQADPFNLVWPTLPL